MQEEQINEKRRRRKAKLEAVRRPSEGVDNDSFEMDDINKRESNIELPSELTQSKHLGQRRHTKLRSRKPVVCAAQNIDAESTSMRQDNVSSLNEIMGIVVHRTDQLRLTADVQYMVIRVHIMNEEHGTYAAKQRQLSSGFNKWDQFVQPIWCSPTALPQGYVQLPVWEELLFIEEPYDSLANTPSTVILFELLNVSTHRGDLDLTQCTHLGHRVTPIAWAFLRLLGANGHANTGLRKQRLQLFEPVPNCKPPGVKSTQAMTDRSEIENLPESMAAGQHLFEWWGVGPSARIKYPSTLYVTVRKIDAHRRTEAVESLEAMGQLRDLKGLESTRGRISQRSKSQAEDQFSDFSDTVFRRADSTMWRRTPGQPCRIPNELIASGTNEMLVLPEDILMSAGDTCMRRNCGSHAVRFSPNGKWLAVGSVSEAISAPLPLSKCQIVSSDAPVFIYKYPLAASSTNPHLQLAGHTNIVYSVDWSPTPILSRIKCTSENPGLLTAWLLASASADGTVRVWWLPPEHLRRRYTKKEFSVCTGTSDRVIRVASCVESMPDGRAVTGETTRRGVYCTVLGHPSFVYCAQFSPTLAADQQQQAQPTVHILATAGFDQIVRLWKIEQLEAKLLCELSGQHRAHINALAFSADGQKLYSADAKGVLVMWNRVETRKQQETTWSWCLDHVVSQPDFKGLAINHVEEHPTQPLLLVHTRDSCLRMVDLRWGFISAQFEGGQNCRELLRSCITPCGSFVISGSEDRNVYVWNAITGDRVACYRHLNLSGSVKSISFHPTQHVVAFASFDREQPVCVYAFNPLSPDTNAEPLRLHISPSAEPKDIPSTAESLRLDKIESDKERRKMNRIRRVLAKLESVRVLRHVPRDVDTPLDDQEWRPTFTTIGEPASPTIQTRGRPDGEAGQPNKSSPRRNTKGDTLEEGRTATLLFDYQAQRSDELTIQRGCHVKLLYKDGPKWWMVRMLSSNLEGYVPTNYLAYDSGVDQTCDRGPSSETTEVNNANALQVPHVKIIPTPAAKARAAANHVAALIRECGGHPGQTQEYEMRPLYNNLRDVQPGITGSAAQNVRRKVRPLPEGGIQQQPEEASTIGPMKRKSRPLPQLQ